MEDRVRLREVHQLSAEELVPLFERDFRNLVTVAIADATRRLSHPVRRLLRSLEWHQDWTDALLWAEGELQVSAERMALVGDDRREGVEGQLRRVRACLHESRRLAADFRRQQYERSDDRQKLLSAQRTALTWLSKAFPEDYAGLVAQVCAERGLAEDWERPAARDVFESIERACHEGDVTVTMTPPVAALLERGPQSFRGVVAKDAREQNERNVLLRHPLVLRRWSSALEELVEMTLEPARASSHTALGTLAEDLRLLGHDRAMRVINSRRFYCAVQQRQHECDRIVRRLMEAITERAAAAPEKVARREAVEHADRLLSARHPQAYARIREALCPYEASPGVLDPVRLTSAERNRLKSRLLQEVTGKPRRLTV
ncbi:hypothetical protein AB0K02_23370 [Streptomyces sp. NPDC049597]|uniref:hypothetical protein n=1 Tax=Streptomyces sp. NPDC049597 TaxID=3155276 RepID=UPI00343A49ED